MFKKCSTFINGIRNNFALQCDTISKNVKTISRYSKHQHSLKLKTYTKLKSTVLNIQQYKSVYHNPKVKNKIRLKENLFKLNKKMKTEQI